MRADVHHSSTRNTYREANRKAISGPLQKNTPVRVIRIAKVWAIPAGVETEGNSGKLKTCWNNPVFASAGRRQMNGNMSFVCWEDYCVLVKLCHLLIACLCS